MTLEDDESWPRRCDAYDAVRDLLEEQATPQEPGRRRSQQPTTAPSSIVVIANRIGVDPQSLYRLVNTPPRLLPWYRLTASARLRDEARLDSFWPYREGLVVQESMTRLGRWELLVTYLRVLALWALHEPTVAACGMGAAPVLPLCVAEDIGIVAGRAAAVNADLRSHVTALALDAAHEVVRVVLDDASVTPAAAYDLVRPRLEPFSRQDRAAAEQLEQVAADVVAIAVFGGGDDRALSRIADRVGPLMDVLYRKLRHGGDGG